MNQPQHPEQPHPDPQHTGRPPEPGAGDEAEFAGAPGQAEGHPADLDDEPEPLSGEQGSGAAQTVDPLTGEPEGEDVDFDTFLDEEGEEDAGRPAWARRRWSLVSVVLAAVIGGLVVALATWTWPSMGGGTVVAEAELVRLGSSAEGTAVATVSESEDGRVLRIQTEGLPDIADGYIQVWLTNAEQGRFLAVGVMAQAHGEFPLPSTFNLESFPNVELTEELYDGDPSHGGRVQWQGDLRGGVAEE